jgi:cobalt-zinc-cadmium efflux system outer membrane protein
MEKKMTRDKTRAVVPLKGFCAAVIAFFSLMLLPLGSPAAGAVRGQAVLERLIDEALANNPELKALKDREEAFSQRPSQAESLDNPKIGFSLLAIPTNSFSFNQEPMTQKQISVSQKVPFPGKLQLKGDIARKETQIVSEDYVERRNDLVRRVEDAFRNLLLVNKTIDVTKENRDLLKEFVKTTETKYAVGEGIQQDVLKAQVELSKMIDKLIALRQEKETAVARLNTLLYRPVRAPLKELEGIEIGGLRHPGFAFTEDELQKVAEVNRPVLMGAKQRIDRYRLALRLAEKNYYPDFDFGVSYGQRNDRPDFVSGVVMVTVPLWYKTKEDKKVAEEKWNIRQATEQYNTAKNKIFFRIKDALARIGKYREQIELFKTGLLPQSRAALESAISGYQVNKVDFITLVNNQVTLYNYEIQYYQAVTDYENTISEIEATVGKRLYFE